MNICLFTDQEINQPLSLRDERGQHIIKILHKKEGETFTAGVIGGMAGTATITKIEHKEVTVSNGKKTYDDGLIYFTFEPQSEGKTLFPLIMIIGFPRPIQLKRLLRDMAALGVSQVHLTGTELGEKSYMKSDMATTDAAYQMLLDGTVQAGSTRVPELFIHQNLRDCIEAVKKQQCTGENPAYFALDNVEPKCSLTKACEGNFSGAVAAIGSERGWTRNERILLKEKGFDLLGMGQRIMRTETAATVSASIILNAMGCLS